mgnify:FL=1
MNFTILKKELEKRILVLDGATGTAIQKYNLSDTDFLGKKGCSEILNITRPDIIKEIHLNYMKAGADIIETNSFNCNSISLSEYNLAEKSYEFSKISASIACEAAKNFSEISGKKIWIAGSVGPTSKSASIPTGDIPYEREISFDELKNSYSDQIRGLIDGGADIILIETIFDGLNAKAALIATEEIFEEKNKFFPVMISATVNKQGKLLSGQSIESLITALDREYIISFGLNCSFGAKDLVPLIKKLSSFTDKYISLYPNAGLPDENGEYKETPEITAEFLKELVEEKAVNILGGCCGTHFGHIKAISKLVSGKEPRKPSLSLKKTHLLSGNEIYSFKDRFTPVGERNNVAGSKIFKKLIEEKNYTKALEIARTQIEKGAAVIDINMDDGLLISHEEIEKYLRVIQNDPLASKVPVMIDSSDFKTIETALKNTAGKSIVNSISLKEGEEIFRKKALIIKKYGAAVIAMAFDEKGQGVSYERKIEICSRSYKILKELGFNDWDIIFDPNILAVGTGSESDRFNGINYIKAVCWIKENLKCGGVIGGLSNLSFSFRGNNALRASIHSVFLKTAKKEGMNFAIMNPGESAPELSEHETSVIEKLLRGEENSLDEILSLSVKKTDTVKKENLEDNFYNRIHKALIYGGSTSFENDISEALNTFSPIEVIQNILMPGMEKVGSMFEKGELYLPQLIRSASVMNKAVDIITPLLAGNEKIQSKGKIIMATVEGDVHDIGKNITGTVLKCSGFEIIDLGVMVSKEKIFETAIKEKADVVTLSGLISPSLKEMEKVLNLFNENSLNIPVIIAGAAASMLHTSIKLAPIYRNKTLYAADALDTLTAAEMLCSDKKDNFLKEKADELNKIAKIYYDNNKNKSIENKPSAEGSNDKFLSPVSSPLKTGKDFIEFSVKDTEPFIKYGLIFHNLKVKDTKEEKEVEKDIKMILDTMKKEKLTVKCSFGIFPCKKNEDSITITENQKNFSIPLKRGIYKPQSTSLSLSDFFNKEDYIGAFTISVFSNFFKDNDYLSLLETLVLTRIAEAGAECLQKYIDKNLWKINIRPVPGYPSLPDHSIKKTIFDLIEGERTGATLTSSFAMTPLSSVCGLYVSNPKSFYFNLD